MFCFFPPHIYLLVIFILNLGIFWIPKTIIKGLRLSGGNCLVNLGLSWYWLLFINTVNNQYEMYARLILAYKYSVYICKTRTLYHYIFFTCMSNVFTIKIQCTIHFTKDLFTYWIRVNYSMVPITCYFL